MSAGRIIVLCMIARVFFVVCCIVLVFSRFGRSELKDPVVPVPPSYNQTYPPVIEASYKGNLDPLRELLSKDANPNVRAFDNSTALHFSVRNGDDSFADDVIKELFKYGARARVTDNNGLAPIHQVPAIAQFNNRENPINNRNNVIHMLFLHGADMNVRTYFQDAGVDTKFNAYDNNKQVTSFDLKKVPKANYNLLETTVNNFDRTGTIDLLDNWGGLFPKEDRKKAAEFAYKIGFRDITDAINAYDESKGAWRENLRKRGLLNIMIGALTGDVALVKKEIKDKNKISEDVYRRTPLHMAVMRQHKPIVELLLKEGAAVNVKDYQGDTPLHQVAWLGEIGLQKELTKLLLQYKASLTEQNERKENILHHAIRLDDLPYVQYLMSSFKPEQLGTDQKNVEGLTPYYLAEKLNLKEMLKVLPKR